MSSWTSTASLAARAVPQSGRGRRTTAAAGGAAARVAAARPPAVVAAGAAAAAAMAGAVTAGTVVGGAMAGDEVGRFTAKGTAAGSAEAGATAAGLTATGGKAAGATAGAAAGGASTGGAAVAAVGAAVLRDIAKGYCSVMGFCPRWAIQAARRASRSASVGAWAHVTHVRSPRMVLSPHCEQKRPAPRLPTCALMHARQSEWPHASSTTTSGTSVQTRHAPSGRSSRAHASARLRASAAKRCCSAASAALVGRQWCASDHRRPTGGGGW